MVTKKAYTHNTHTIFERLKGKFMEGNNNIGVLV